MLKLNNLKAIGPGIHLEGRHLCGDQHVLRKWPLSEPNREKYANFGHIWPKSAFFELRLVFTEKAASFGISHRPPLEEHIFSSISPNFVLFSAIESH